MDAPALGENEFSLSKYLAAPWSDVSAHTTPSLKAASNLIASQASWQQGSEDLSESGNDEDEDEDGMGGPSSSGSEESGDEGTGRPRKASDELEESTEDELSRISCGLCSKALVERRRPGAGRGADPTRVRICDACHKAFHAGCCRRRGVGVKVRDTYSRHNTLWFCSDTCEKSHHVLTQRCQAGPQVLPKAASQPHDLGLQAGDPAAGRGLGTGPATWLLASSAGRRADPGQRRGMEEVVSVLSEHYGPFVARQVEGSDYGAVLLRGDMPVAAATMDCFGPDACALDMLATRQDVRGCGNARALVTSLESFLGESGAAKQLLAVVDVDQGGSTGLLGSRSGAGWRARARASGLPGMTDEEDEEGVLGVGPGGVLRGRALWVRRLGFKPLTKRQARALRAKFPVLTFYAPSAVFYAKQLQGPPQVVGAVASKKAVQRGKGMFGKGLEGEMRPIAEGLAQPAQQQWEGEQQERRRPRNSHWRLRLWAWAARKVLSAATFGLL